MAEENVPLIEARDLEFSYRAGEKILRGISFQIGCGELVAVTGPSGSGKSTLFYLLGCLLDKYSGDVVFRGQSTKALASNEKSWLRNREIGFVFQQFYLLPRATVRENILLPTYFPFDDSSPSATDRVQVEEIATKLGIAGLLDRNPQELSGGQQQRVAIARALLRRPQLILADEPTGNLDSKSSDSVMQLLKDLHREGHTVVIVTHSPEIAAQCERVIHVKDGELERDEHVNQAAYVPVAAHPLDIPHSGFGKLGVRSFFKSLPIAWSNIKRSRAKSALTMLGVSLGVAAVLSTMSLGAFAKQKILEGYQSLGVNTLRFYGYRDWMPSGSAYAPASFREFNWDVDIVPLSKIFDELAEISPFFNLSKPKVRFGGREFNDNPWVGGVNENYLSIAGQSVAEGRAFSSFDLTAGAPVCIIGADVRVRLFPGGLNPINQRINVDDESTNSAMPCRVVGVLARQASTQSETQANSMIMMPYTYFVKVVMEPYYRTMSQFIVKINDGYEAAATGDKLVGFFKMRYGNSGYFAAASDAKLIAQMNMFLNVFSGLLATVALIALLVGGVGINNMMLASLSERLKELGLRKALGATPRQLRNLMLGESVLLCTTAGVVGLAVGFAAYQGTVLAATRLIPKLEFEWIFEPTAFVISFAAIFITGLCSGLIPAMKAEKLDVMEALRQDV